MCLIDAIIVEDRVLLKPPSPATGKVEDDENVRQISGGELVKRSGIPMPGLLGSEVETMPRRTECQKQVPGS